MQMQLGLIIPAFAPAAEHCLWRNLPGVDDTSDANVGAAGR